MRNCVPAGWEIARIGQLVDRLQYGHTAKAEADALGPRFLRITDIENGQINWSSVPGCGITPDDFKKYELADGDVVFARTGSIEKACMVRHPPEAVFASYLIRGKPLLRELSEWLHHFAQSLSYRRQALELSAGIGRANINAKSIGEIELPIAPLPEQHRIVEAIESYLTRLDDAVASLERVQRNLERYRASVLKAAVEGRLVPTEAEAFRRENWLPVGRALASLDQGWSPRCDREASSSNQEWGVIKTTAVQALEYVETANKRLPAALEPRPHLELQPGDILVTRAGPRSRVGVCALVRSTRPKLMLCDKAYRLRCDPRIAVPEYIELVLNASPIVTSINSMKTGISDSGVNLTQKRFKELPIPLPSKAAQEGIAAEVSRLWSLALASEQGLLASVGRAAVLRQSILKWAFDGKLVEQDPNDEPASALLERVRSDREGIGR